MIATVAARTGIAPLALRDCAIAEPELFDEIVVAADRWTPELELAASTLEVEHETMRVVLALGGAKRLPEPLAIPRRRELPRSRPATQLSVGELAALTGRPIHEPEAGS